MRALIKEGRSLAVRGVPRPKITASDEVVIRVAAAGVCRTDVYVAEGRIPSREPIILGHELSGVVEAIGERVDHVQSGDRVTVRPMLACGACRECRDKRSDRCAEPRMLGVEVHGAFAEALKVPAAAVYRLPPSVSDTSGAYVEPIAASLAVLKAGIRSEQRGLIWGTNRIAQLTARVLVAHGFASVTISDRAEALEASAFDFAIETSASTESMRALVRVVRPEGCIVLKSRTPAPVGLELSAAIAKELVFRAVGWGSFTDAIALLSDRRVVVDDLLGDRYALESFEAAFAAATRESSKPYFAF